MSCQHHGDFELQTTFELESKRKVQNRIAQQQHRARKRARKLQNQDGSTRSVASLTESMSPTSRERPLSSQKDAAITTYDRRNTSPLDSNVDLCEIFDKSTPNVRVSTLSSFDLSCWGDETVSSFGEDPNATWNFPSISTRCLSESQWPSATLTPSERVARPWTDFVNAEELGPLCYESERNSQEELKGSHQKAVTSTRRNEAADSNKQQYNYACSETRDIEKISPPVKFPDKKPKATAASDCEEELETILSSARKMGFRNFDELATWYYTSTPSSSFSVLQFSQKMSRQRHLAGVFETIFTQSAQWSESESQGIKHAVMRAAEDVMGEEIKNLGKRIEVEGRTAKGQEQYPTPRPSPHSDEQEIGPKLCRNSLQESMPNTVALLMELLSSTTLMSQREISETVFDSLAVLCRSKLKREGETE